jgi:SulP family sulfate permease
MPSRRHLFSLQFAHALRESVLREPYSRQRFGQDALAGLTVGIISIPLAMALAIASGVAPQYGLYTAIIAGFLIALAGGSRYSVSGPTAAFVVILYPIAQTWGLGGLLVATMMSGVILVGMALLRLGRLIQYIPESVVLGFTAGIAVVIVTLQLKDLFGLPIDEMPEHFIDKLQVLVGQAGAVHLPSVAVAALTLTVMLLWPRLRTPVPAHLPAILLASLAALLLAGAGHPVETIGSRFSYTLGDGSPGAGIPPVLPLLQWPWLREGADGAPILWSWQAVQALLLMVAWNMSEAPKAVHLLRKAPGSDVLVFLTCFTLTVVFDMVIAIGMVLAALLFMKEIADMTRVADISENRRLVSEPPPDGWCIL